MSMMIADPSQPLPGSPTAGDRRGNRFDSMRLLAAWLVLFSHSFPLGGWPDREPLASTVGIDTLGGLGVAIFFVLSGYLVTQSLLRCPNPLVFAWRRALRIFPALLVACLMGAFAFGLAATRLPWDEYLLHAETWAYLKTASAFHIRYVLPGVFESNPLPRAVNGSLWSLPYELGCYLTLMAAALLPARLRFVALAALVSLAALLVMRPATPPAAPDVHFLGLDYYHNKLGLLFALGAVCATWRAPLRHARRLGPIAMGVALLLPHGGWQTTLFFTGFGLFILWLGSNARWLPAVPERMGDWSYGVYLYAFPVQQTLVWLGTPALGWAAFVLLGTALTLPLAAASWHLVEKRALRWK